MITHVQAVAKKPDLVAAASVDEVWLRRHGAVERVSCRERNRHVNAYCVVCGCELPPEPLFHASWLRLPGGYLCPTHRRQMEIARERQGFHLGHGIYLVVAASVPVQE